MSWRPIKDYIDFRFRQQGGNHSDRKLFDQWAKGKDIIRFTPGPSDLIDLRRFLRTAHRYYLRSSCRQDMPPHIDHAIAFKSADGKCWLTYQPYVSAQSLRPLVSDWAASQGLRVTVYDEDRSWYYPGNTCLVVVEVGN